MGLGSPEITNLLYFGLLFVALLNLIVYLTAQLRREQSARPNLQHFDVRKASDGNNFDKIPLRIVFVNVGSRPAKVKRAFATVGGSEMDAIPLSTTIVRFGEFYILELQDTFRRWIDDVVGSNKPDKEPMCPITLHFTEIDNSDERTVKANVPFYPETPVHQDLKLASWVDVTDGKRPPVWNR